MKNAMNEQVKISKEQLMAHENNPRKDIGDISELTQSIKKNGIMQNLTVMPVDDKDEFDVNSDKFVILIGHRRFEAGKKAGLKEFPCNIVTGLTEREQLSIMLEENMQRTDLTIIEQAQGFQMMLDLGETAESIAKKTGFSKSTVRHRLNITKLDKDIIQDKEDKSFQLTLMDFCELEKIKDIDKRNEVLKKATSSENLKWQIQREVDKEKADKMKEKLLKLLAKKGLSEAPEHIAGNMYDNSIKRIDSIYVSADRDPVVPEMDLSGDCYYCVRDSWVYIVREKTEEELEEEKASKVDEKEEARNKLISIEVKIKDEREAFIKGLLKTDIKDDVRDELWNIIIKHEVNIGYDEIYSFLTGKDTWRINDEDRAEHRETVDSFDTVKQMLCLIEQGCDSYITNWQGEYNIDTAEIQIEFTKILEKFGFSYENEEEYNVLLGTHEDFVRPVDPEEDEDVDNSSLIDTSDISENSYNTEDTENADIEVIDDNEADENLIAA